MALKEINSLRSRTMKVFDKAPGERVYRCHVGNIHYPDSSKVFQNIDTTLLTQAGGFYQDKCFYHSEVPDKADGVFGFYNRDHYFSLKLVGVKSVGYTALSGVWGDLGKGYCYKDAFGDGIDFEAIAKNMSFEKRICFRKPPPDITKDFSFEYEIVDAPNRLEFKDRMGGATTIIDPSKVVSEAISIENKITSIYSTTGKYKSLIHFPRCYDSNSDNRVSLPVKILFYTSGGKTYLRKIIPKEIFEDAVYPIYADDPVRYDPPAGDGNMESNAYYVWDTAHDAASGSVNDSAAEIELGGLRGPTVDTFKLMRGFVPIDTSGITDGDTVTAATFYMYGYRLRNNEDNDGDDWLSTVQTTNNNPNNLISNDFNNCGDSIDNPTEGNDSGARIDITNWSIIAYNTIVLNATGVGWVNKTGYTMLGVREGHDCLDSPLSVSGSYQGSRVEMYSSEQTGTAQDPYLDVTASGAGTTYYQNTGQGVAVSTGILSKKTSKFIGSHALSIAGTLNKKTTPVTAMGGHAIDIVGILSKKTAPVTVMGGHAVNIAGTLGKKTSKFIGNHALSIAGTLNKKTTPVTAMGDHAIDIVGTLSKKTTPVTVMGGYALSIAGVLAKAVVLTQNTGGHAMTITGALTSVITFVRVVGDYAVNIVGTLLKKTSKSVGEGQVTSTGILVKKTSKDVGSGSVISIGTLAIAIMYTQAVGGASMSIIGSLATQFIAGVGGAVNFIRRRKTFYKQ